MKSMEQINFTLITINRFHTIAHSCFVGIGKRRSVASLSFAQKPGRKGKIVYLLLRKWNQFRIRNKSLLQLVHFRCLSCMKNKPKQFVWILGHMRKWVCIFITSHKRCGWNGRINRKESKLNICFPTVRGQSQCKLWPSTGIWSRESLHTLNGRGNFYICFRTDLW